MTEHTISIYITLRESGQWLTKEQVFELAQSAGIDTDLSSTYEALDILLDEGMVVSDMNAEMVEEFRAA